MREEIKEKLDDLTCGGELYEGLKDGRIRCCACAHYCAIPEGREGICRVRLNRGGRLRVPCGYVSSLQVDPIEKKPFYHVVPGSRTMSFGMLGCNFRCAFCQNWTISQAFREDIPGLEVQKVSAGEIARACQQEGIRIITSTYNEPLITAEWAVEILRAGKESGIRGAFVSNGYATPEVLEYIKPYVSYFKVDLKCFSEKTYREIMGSQLKKVLDSIALLVSSGFWVEVVTLLVPGMNDTEAEIKSLTSYLASISRDIPWHVSAFHPEYRMSEAENTSLDVMTMAVETGRAAGLNFVYGGNVPQNGTDWGNTRCPNCKALLVERSGYVILRNALKEGACPECGLNIPGRWS